MPIVPTTDAGGVGEKGGSAATPLGLSSYQQVRQATPEPCEKLQFTPKEAKLKRMRDGVFLGCRLAEAELHRPGFRAPEAWMLTLTYEHADAWEPRHVSTTVDRLRKWARRSGYPVAGVWCAEMQDKRYRVRGELAIHYHIVIWLPRGVIPPKPDKQGWWKWGMTKREKVRVSANAYIAKYASKGTEAPLPKGARTYASFGLEEQRSRYTYLRRPGWLRALVALGERVIRSKGGGWVSLDSGEFYESPWRFSFVQGTVVLVKKGTEPWAVDMKPS